MKVTNALGLPAPVYSFAEYSANRKYSAGNADWSVTTLIDSPRIDALYKKHRNEIEVDITDLAMSMLGSAMHHIWESSTQFDHVAEERLTVEIDGYKITGQIDLQEVVDDRINLIDFKVTTTGAWARASWERQMNMYALLVEIGKDRAVGRLQICALYRNWQKSKVGSKDYPETPIELIDIPQWTFEERLRYARERIALFAAVRESGELPDCAMEERWGRPPKWAVGKSERAFRVFDTREEAEKFVKGRKTDGWAVTKRPSINIRCESWCPVREFCDRRYE